MKTLILVRHAKSSWDNPNIPDHERPLNKRGERDAPFMGDILKEKNLTVDMIVSSTASRAHTTAMEIAKRLDYPVDNIETDEIIYHAGAKNILKLIQTFNDDWETVIMFGHNPDLNYLASYLSGEPFEKFPTCGITAIDFDIHSWIEIDDKNGRLRFFEYPKKYPKEERKKYD